jgi:hypothetical protein
MATTLIGLELSMPNQEMMLQWQKCSGKWRIFLDLGRG